MTGALFALIGSVFFGSADVVVRRGMRTTRENGVFIATFVNVVIFGVLITVLLSNHSLPALTSKGFLPAYAHSFDQQAGLGEES